MQRKLLLVMIILMLLASIAAACNPVNRVSSSAGQVGNGVANQSDTWNSQIDSVDQTLQDLERSLNSIDTMKDVGGLR